MSTVQGSAKAAVRQNGKTRYIPIGRWTCDEDGRIAVIVETLPRDMANWTGWINLFSDSSLKSPNKTNVEVDDDDIHF